MRNLLIPKYLQRGARGASGPGPRVGCDPEKFFCIFFSISELRHFVNFRIWFKVVHFRADKCKVVKLLIFSQFG